MGVQYIEGIVRGWYVGGIVKQLIRDRRKEGLSDNVTSRDATASKKVCDYNGSAVGCTQN